MIFKNIFSSYYSFFLRQKAAAPIYATVNLLALALTIWSMLIWVLIKRYNGFNAPYISFFHIAFYIFLIYFLYKYYKKEKEMIKVNNGLKVFNAKKGVNKFLWNTISFTFLLLPVVLIAVLLS